MDSQELLQKSYMLHGASEVWKSVICKSYVPITCSWAYITSVSNDM